MLTKIHPLFWEGRAYARTRGKPGGERVLSSLPEFPLHTDALEKVSETSRMGRGERERERKAERTRKRERTCSGAARS